MGKFRRKDQQIQQGEFWVSTAKLARGPKDHFYARLQKVLEGIDFTGQIHRTAALDENLLPGGALAKACRYALNLRAAAMTARSVVG